jgi:hypothetical protein
MANKPAAEQFEPFTRRADFGGHLKGLGGPTIHLRGFPGATYGAANAGRRLSAEERAEVVERLRREGVLGSPARSPMR